LRTGTRSAKSHAVTCKRILTLSEWSADVLGQAVVICREVFQKFNWTEPDEGLIRKIISDTFGRKVD